YVSVCIAQTDSVYTLPFPDGTTTSKGNTIDLTIANTSSLSAQNVSVSVANIPDWLKFDTSKQTLSSVAGSTEQTASFTFAVSKSAAVGKKQTLAFSISANGQTWTKNISVKVAPPASYQLFQNYPNPFNPTTTISYQLSQPCHVDVRVYDILGREITSLVDERQDAGYYQKVFNAQRLASGIYFERLIATDGSNNKHVFKKKMLMIK
ncbi:MAG TPA: T9SS type A sorting domain-containing protein, partial [Bacteroidota bacterium]|nr:T9SS type A sorting domain-containing protein [Bacteroidota bacterium]